MVWENQEENKWWGFILYHCRKNLCSKYLPQQEKLYSCKKKKSKDETNLHVIGFAKQIDKAMEYYFLYFAQMLCVHDSLQLTGETCTQRVLLIGRK